MIICPIIPIWLMAIISGGAIIFIVYHRKSNDKRPKGKRYVLNLIVKVSIVILLFIINLRFMLPDGEAVAINSDLNILFVIDTSVSMRALDYEGNKERWEGVIKDCCHIVDELSGCKFSIITFGDTAQRLIPFTNDSDMVQSELEAISIENDFYAEGSSMNLAKSILEKTLKDEQNRKNGDAKTVVFFITDGEITKEEELESFENVRQYISNGAVLGYGTLEGGKMINSMYAEEPTSEFYYVYYYDNSYNLVTAVSKLDEKNLQKLASDLKIDYIQMDKTSNINYKIDQLKAEALKSQTNKENKASYQDTYYYFAIPLAILLVADFIIKKKRIR